MTLGTPSGMMPATSQTLAPFEGVIHVPLATNPLSLNVRLHWRTKAKHTKQWRQFAAVGGALFPVLPACDVTLTWFVIDARKRDEDNLYPLLKALCDGLVDAGVVRDDTPDLMGKTCRIVRAPEGTTSAFMELRVRSRVEGGEQG